ncbi:CHASE3 domain-containing protein [Okeania sp.]|uniref:CHASE3 domain-containing protein n=1 Tax=Okeania sp. TaxID=3100323 RepID=UPI002B4AEB46|nr:CHASE3 domain-containing protein [Okeania sp.]MEB3340670.1 CHASE3 domain-containing protein [Okeania sp.]
MNLRQVLPVGVIIIIATFGISNIFSQSSIRTLKESSEWVAHTYQVKSLLKGLEKTLVDAETGQRGFIYSGQGNFLEPYNLAQQTIDDNLDELQAKISDNPEQLKRLAKIADLTESKISELKETIKLKRAGEEKKVRQLILSGLGKQIMDEIRQKIDEMMAVEDQLLNERKKQAKQAFQLVIIISWSSLMIVVIVSIIIIFLINKIAIQPINIIANLIATSTNEISATVEQQEHTAFVQANSVHTTTNNMDELGAFFRQSSQEANAANNTAQLALEAAEKGSDTVCETFDAMNNLKVKVEAIAHQIFRLNDQINQIGQISQMVSNLANQINMLALNAKVEAVRDGDNTQGFSVVAAEIKKLAIQSKLSAEKIRILVEEIQDSIHATVLVTKEGIRTVELGMKITDQTTASFSRITKSVNNVVINNQQIYLNIQQQVHGIKQVLEAMENINQVAKETALGIGQTHSGVESLKKAAEKLKNIV